MLRQPGWTRPRSSLTGKAWVALMGWQIQLPGRVCQHVKGLVVFGRWSSVCLLFLGEPRGKPKRKAWLMSGVFFRYVTFFPIWWIKFLPPLWSFLSFLFLFYREGLQLVFWQVCSCAVLWVQPSCCSGFPPVGPQPCLEPSLAQQSGAELPAKGIARLLRWDFPAAAAGQGGCASPGGAVGLAASELPPESTR